MEDKKLQNSILKGKKLWGEIIAIIAGIIVAMIHPPEALSAQAMWAMGIMTWAVINWIFDCFPDYVVCMFMLVLLAGLKIVDFSVAFSAFSSPMWWMLVVALGVGHAAFKSGLIRRISLYIMRLFKPNFNGQVLAILASGTIISPFIPSSLARTSIAAPLAMGISDTLGYEKCSKGSAGLFLAMNSGYFLIGPVFLSAATFCYMIKGQLPPEVQAQFTWSQWTISTLPYLIVMLVGSYLAITRFYNNGNKDTLPENYIKEQLNELGPMNREEKITLAVLLVSLVFWVLESVLDIPAVVTTTIAFCVLLATHVIDKKDVHTRLNWSMLIFIGGIIGMSNILPALGINGWLSSVIGPHISAFASNPYIFILILIFVMILLRFIMASVAAAITMVMAIFIPVAVTVGINPWIVGFAAYTSSLVWFLSYQNSGFLMGYAASGGEERVAYSSIVKMSICYVGIVTVGLLISVPYWQMIGLIG